MKKRFTALLLAVITCISIFPCAISAASVSLDDTLGLMNTIGVIAPGKITEENADLPISRLDFVMIISELLGLTEDIASDNDYFYDIPEDHWGKKKLNAMVERKLISVGEHYFRPDDTITKAEAATIVVTAIGRQEEANFRGGYPSGYLTVAENQKLFRGTSRADKLTYKDAAVLLYNTAIEEVAYVNFIGDGMKFEGSGETILSLYHDIYFGEGILSAIEGVSIDNTSAGKDEVVIGGERFDTKNWYYDFLGLNVKYFYEEDKDENRSVIYVMNEDEDKQEIITTNSNYYHNYDGDYIYYREDADSSKLEKIKVYQGATVVVNGEKANTNMTTALDKNNIYGTIRIVDTDRFDGAELIIIENYENLVVSYIDRDNKKVYSKDSTSDGLNLDEEKGITVKYFNTDGTIANFDSIAAGSLISTAVSSDDKTVIIRLSSKTVTGIVNQKGMDDYGVPYFVVDDVLYNAQNTFYSQNGTVINTGSSANFSVDVLGNIASFSNIKTDGMQYACLINAKIAFSVGQQELDTERVIIKMYTANGEHISVPCAEKVKVDGYTYRNNQEILDSISSTGVVQPQGIRFKYDSKGFVKVIDTVYNPTSEGDYTLRKLNITDSTYFHWTGQLGNFAYLPDGIPVMIVPSKSVIKTADPKHFTIKNRSALGNSATYNLDVFTTDENALTPEYIICYQDIVKEASSIGEIYVVEKVKKSLNSDDEVVTCLTLDNSGEATYFVSAEYENKAMETWTHVNPDSLSPGDVVRISLDNVGDIVDIKLVLDYSKAIAGDNDRFFENGTNFSINPNNMIGSNTGWVTGYGYVSKKANGVFAWGYNSPSEVNQVYSSGIQSSQLKIMVFDGDKRENRCTDGSLEDMISYEESTSRFSKILTVQNDRVLRQMIIYK